MCFLNLSNAMKTFGPLRLLWKGGYQGEGYLRIVKNMQRWDYVVIGKIVFFIMQ